MCEPHLQHCMYDLSVGSFWNRTLGNELLHISSFKLQFHAYWHETQATRLFLYYAATERSFGAHWHTSSTPEIEKVFEDFSVTITLRSPSSRDPRHCHVSASISPPPFCIFYLATQRSPSLMGDKLAKLRRLASPGGNQSKLELPKWRKWLVFSALGVQAQGPYADINTKILPSPFMHHRPIVTIAHNLRLSNITEVGRHRSPNIGSSTLKKKSFNIYITHIANS